MIWSTYQLTIQYLIILIRTAYSKIASAAIEENVIPQFLIYQQKVFYEADTIYANEKQINRIF